MRTVPQFTPLLGCEAPRHPRLGLDFPLRCSKLIGADLGLHKRTTYKVLSEPLQVRSD